MKHLIIITLMAFALQSDSQNEWRNEWLKQDKALHVSCSAILTMTGVEIGQDIGLSRHEAEIAAIGLSLAVGVGKEFLYDSRPSPHDLAANIVGAVAGVYINRLLQSIPTQEVRRQKRIERKLKRFNFETI
jgi:uncharacterized protein YfiM (DUF2279 family)